MRYGACSWVFGDSPLPEVAEGLARLGYDGIELLGDWNLYPPSTARRILADHGLVVFALTPKDVDLAHPDAEVRREALDHYFGLLEFAAELGAPAIGCHGAVGRCWPLATQAEEEAWFSEGVARIADRAQRGGLCVALEPLNRYESHLLTTAAQGRALADRIRSPAVGLLLDAYHMNIEEANPVAALRPRGRSSFSFT